MASASFHITTNIGACLNRRLDKVDRFIQDELVTDDGLTTII
jgi:hypothetical protein